MLAMSPSSENHGALPEVERSRFEVRSSSSRVMAQSIDISNSSRPCPWKHSSDLEDRSTEGRRHGPAQVLFQPNDQFHPLAPTHRTGRTFSRDAIPGDEEELEKFPTISGSSKPAVLPRKLPDYSHSFADPLAPLRDRDQAALQAFFELGNMYEIEADITRYLLLLWPEPCWEDDPFDFLQDFL